MDLLSPVALPGRAGAGGVADVLQLGKLRHGGGAPQCDGSLDRTFAPAGTPAAASRNVDAFGRDERTYALAVDGAGHILVTGSAQWPTGSSENMALALARLLPDGRIDTSFGGGDGVAAVDARMPDSENAGRAVFLAPEGASPTRRPLWSARSAAPLPWHASSTICPAPLWRCTKRSWRPSPAPRSPAPTAGSPAPATSTTPTPLATPSSSP
jgi:hypothetical protein